MTWSYSGSPSDSDVDAVRFEIQDVNAQAPLLQDEEIQWAVLSENDQAAGTPATISGITLYGPAAKCCDVLARRFLTQADSQIGQLKITSTKRAAQYQEMAQALRLKAQGYASPYAGGQSVSEKMDFNSDPDAVKPKFSITQWNNPWTGEQDSAAYDTEDFGPPVG